MAGTATLVRFILRRDRIRIPAWLLGLVAVTVGGGTSFPEVYPTIVERQAQAAIIASSPAMAAMTGPGYGVQDYTYGAMIANEMFTLPAVLVALMSILLLVRHTRAEEEADRAELVRSAVVGRHAHLTAAVLAVVGINLVLGALVAVGYASLGIESVTRAGSLAFGAALASVGIVFTAVAAVTAQVTGHARAASSAAGALLGAAFVLRAAGDMGVGALSWASPIGWAQQVRAYVDERWWPLGLSLLLTAVLLAVAYGLSSRRDVGAGLLPERGGAAGASRLLGSPFGLALRLHRSALLGWVVAMLLLNLAYGSISGVVEDYADNEIVREMMAAVGGASLVEQWISTILSLVAMIGTIFAVLTTLRLRREETSGRAEPLLATGVSRTRWMASHLAVALLGGAVVLLAAGLALGLSAAASQGDGSLIAPIIGAALAYTPAMWVTAGVAAALFGLLPRAAGLVWTVLVYAILIGYFGVLLRLPEWALELSPFAHVPRMPGEPFAALPVLVLTALAAALVGIGLVGFRRRDLDLR
jgi:ABC-2 type transport system permease protein